MKYVKTCVLEGVVVAYTVCPNTHAWKILRELTTGGKTAQQLMNSTCSYTYGNAPSALYRLILEKYVVCRGIVYYLTDSGWDYVNTLFGASNT